MFDRMLTIANELVTALRLTGPEVVSHDDPSKHKIGELDAKRFIVKSLRELRQGIALGGQIEPAAIEAIAAKMAAHLGTNSLVPIKKALSSEVAVFAKEFVEGVEKLGKNAHFHEDHGVIDSREFPAEANYSPPPSSPLHRAHFDAVRKALGK